VLTAPLVPLDLKEILAVPRVQLAPQVPKVPQVQMVEPLITKNSRVVVPGQNLQASLLFMSNALLAAAVADRVVKVLLEQVGAVAAEVVAVFGPVVICLHPLWAQLKLLPLAQEAPEGLQ
jgi:hypothetical protein